MGLGHGIETHLPAWQRMARSSTLGARAKDKGGRFVQEIDPPEFGRVYVLLGGDI